MRKKDLIAVRNLMNETGMLEVYAEQVIKGRLSKEKALKLSFEEVKRITQGQIGKLELYAEKHLGTEELLLTLSFRLTKAEADIVNQAIERAQRELGGKKNCGEALKVIAERYLR